MAFQYDELQVRVGQADAALVHAVTLTAGRTGLRCEFEFDDYWSGLGKVCIVKSNGTSETVTITQTGSYACVTIPSARMVAGNNLFVGLYGTNGSTIVIPTIWCCLGTIYSGTSAPTIPETTGSYAAQILSYMNEALAARISAVILEKTDINKYGTANMAMSLGSSGSALTCTRTGDGATKIFNAAVDGVVFTTCTSVTVAGVEKTLGTDYTFNVSNGNVTFTTAPANGASIVISGTTNKTVLNVTAEYFKGKGIKSGAFDSTTRKIIFTYDDNTTTEITAIDDALDIVEAGEATRLSNETTRQGNETVRQGAETDRASAEDSRVTAETNRASAESARVTAETARASAEESRVTAETGRSTAETARETAETTRANSETNRANAETTRASNENTRQSNEATRQSNESSRTSAETARSNAENTRASNETTRIASENTRVTAENARVSAENARSSAESTRSSNESSRQTNETARQTAETSRATAENSRGTAETARASAETARVTAESARVTAEAARVTEFTSMKHRMESYVNSEVLFIYGTTQYVNEILYI